MLSAWSNNKIWRSVASAGWKTASPRPATTPEAKNLVRPRIKTCSKSNQEGYQESSVFRFNHFPVRNKNYIIFSVAYCTISFVIQVRKCKHGCIVLRGKRRNSKQGSSSASGFQKLIAITKSASEIVTLLGNINLN